MFCPWVFGFTTIIKFLPHYSQELLLEQNPFHIAHQSPLTVNVCEFEDENIAVIPAFLFYGLYMSYNIKSMDYE